MKPNILFILSDDHGAWALGSSGNSDIKTPNLDQLAKEGMRYSNFFCASPVCSPARASIITGCMPSAHGVHDYLRKGHLTVADYEYMKGYPHFKLEDVGIDYLEGQETYIEKLSANGYRCGLSGKWHLGDNPKKKKGFDKWTTIATGGSDYYHCEVVEDNKFEGNEGNYISDIITDRAISHLDGFVEDEKPFYLSVHYTAPHAPWGINNHPKEYLDLYEDCLFESVPHEPVHVNQIKSEPVGETKEKCHENLRGYFAAITAMDANIGRLIQRLKDLDVYENTIIIYTADNGMNMGHHGIWGKGNGTYPPNMYEESVKVPFLMKASFMKSTNVENKSCHSHCDLFPTILEMAGIEHEVTKYQCGKSFYSEILDEKLSDDGDVVICDEYGIVHMLRTLDYKFIKNYESGEEIFYDLKNDPKENSNEIQNPTYQSRIAQMRTTIEEWFERYTREGYTGKYAKMNCRGQIDLITAEKSFDTNIPYYFEELHKEQSR